MLKANAFTILLYEQPRLSLFTVIWPNVIYVRWVWADASAAKFCPNSCNRKRAREKEKKIESVFIIWLPPIVFKLMFASLFLCCSHIGRGFHLHIAWAKYLIKTSRRLLGTVTSLYFGLVLAYIANVYVNPRVVCIKNSNLRYVIWCACAQAS